MLSLLLSVIKEGILTVFNIYKKYVIELMLLIENSTICSTFDIPKDEQINAFIQISNPQNTVRFYNFLDKLFLFKL